MNTEAPIALNGLARRLVRDGSLSEEIAQKAQQEASKDKKHFVSHLVTNNYLDSATIAEAAADEFGAPLFDLSAFNKEVIPKELIDIKLVQKHHSLPLFRRGNRLFIAVSDPTNLRALDEIKFHTGINTDAVLVNEELLAQALIDFIEANDEPLGGLGDLEDAGLEDLDIEAVDEEGGKDDKGADGADETPIVRFVNKVLIDAIKTGASDIHFEPYEKSYRVRFRTDGILHEVARPPMSLAGRLSSRLKVMSQMDISERRLPQDGRIKMKLSKKRAIDFRVNTLPCLFGEKVVLRILDPSSAQMGIDALGYEPEQKDMYMQALLQPQGMILVTGPTGSGKTVSLYTGLNILNEPERNISTAEDPVEINLEGINQCHVNPKVGLTFAEALRSFLRQDPDIIMVGEIRDLETAEISIKAAQTGHMVMSTLHTNSAAETITRLMNMGVPAFNIATSVNLIIAQRLGRRLCSHCAEPADIPKEVLLEEGFLESDLEDLNLMKAVGCDKCANGYKGRVGIYEVVRITPALSQIIMDGGNSIDIDKIARQEGFNDLRRSALLKAAQGLTSLEEVNRVTKD
ncbi:type IV-A pilus assembly ATPase PilB [Dasania sp. GY-MA-18]|uniref:Type IV-A pilus assembly ATPase PilB n=1 Tax=Dasania phycosphaerae TaxID=2950436 RepID=A0A9J6RNJ6_9GAMM|nr:MULTISPECIES: type IV-A pilus assembly ATPase PilB [Dasania]MCR8923673.1 type IV-A pilus assembly ATPase PilB [Dasania sp. GY-MA-18]MCZ0866107.1 type IV-A pilus assembly ATPase PilB [Dasania phycosphaerae]MCZ0869831.1 type IV-A pilus assembly ATPase PilB [Dasania phycosphaerae]